MKSLDNLPGENVFLFQSRQKYQLNLGKMYGAIVFLNWLPFLVYCNVFQHKILAFYSFLCTPAFLSALNRSQTPSYCIPYTHQAQYLYRSWKLILVKSQVNIFSSSSLQMPQTLGDVGQMLPNFEKYFGRQNS